MTTPSPSIRRFRGCFIGGPFHGRDLPAVIRPGGKLRVPLAPGPEGGPDHALYKHRRLEETLEDGSVDSVEFLILDSFEDEVAATFVDAEKRERGGWGAPVVTLPVAGYRFHFESFYGWEFGEEGQRQEQLRLGVVTRFSPHGICIAAHLCDESRALSREEADASRCGWCEEGIGHTLEEHRTRLAATAAAERALEIQPFTAEERLDVAPMSELSLAVARILYGAHPDREAVAQFEAEIREQVLKEAHAEFLRRREAEAVEAGEVDPEAPGLIQLAHGYRSRA